MGGKHCQGAQETGGGGAGGRGGEQDMSVILRVEMVHVKTYQTVHCKAGSLLYANYISMKLLKTREN